MKDAMDKVTFHVQSYQVDGFEQDLGTIAECIPALDVALSQCKSASLSAYYLSYGGFRRFRGVEVYLDNEDADLCRRMIPGFANTLVECVYETTGDGSGPPTAYLTYAVNPELQKQDRLYVLDQCSMNGSDYLAWKEAKRMITAKEAAAQLDGNEYTNEGSKELFDQMKRAGLVAVFGASDDLIEFRGAIDDETGHTAWLTRFGLFQATSEDDDNPLDAWKRNRATKIECDHRDGAYRYETAIPHETFTIEEDGEPYCVGMVFAMADIRDIYADLATQIIHATQGDPKRTNEAAEVLRVAFG